MNSSKIYLAVLLVLNQTWHSSAARNKKGQGAVKHNYTIATCEGNFDGQYKYICTIPNYGSVAACDKYFPNNEVATTAGRPSMKGIDPVGCNDVAKSLSDNNDFEATTYRRRSSVKHKVKSAKVLCQKNGIMCWASTEQQPDNAEVCLDSWAIADDGFAPYKCIAFYNAERVLSSASRRDG